MYQLLVWALLQPYTFAMLLLGIGIAVLWWRRRETRKRLLAVTVLYALLWIVSFPPIAFLALGSLEWRNPPLYDRPSDAQAIVVLSSYVYPPDGVRRRAELDEDTLKRCLTALDLYHQGAPLPIVVTGGKSGEHVPGPSSAEAMQEFLVQLGVRAADVLIEAEALTTFENAVFSRKLLDERGLKKIIVITDGPHLVRAAACFRKQELQVIPCGCQYRATAFHGTISDFLPQASAALHCGRAAHEWLGLAWYWLRGRI